MTSDDHNRFGNAILKARERVFPDPQRTTEPAVLVNSPIVVRPKVRNRPATSRTERTDVERVDPAVQEYLVKIAQKAEEMAIAAHNYLEGYTRHLLSIGCSAESLLDYFRAERRTLGSLYFEARKSVPSPTEIRNLALRFVLDARKSIEGFPWLFTVEQSCQGWRVARHGSSSDVLLPAPPRGIGDLVGHPYAVGVLNCAFRAPPDNLTLVAYIETIFGDIPTPLGTLDAADCPAFTFAVDESPQKLVVR